MSTEEIVRAGVRGAPGINAIATRGDHEVEILIWNYHDDDLPATPAPIDLAVDGLPEKVRSVSVKHFRVDATHSNAFRVWKEMGSPQPPSAAQYVQLQDSGQLQFLASPSWIAVERGTAHLQFALPRQSLSLVRIAW